VLLGSSVFGSGQPTRLRIVNGCSQGMWSFSIVGSGGGTLSNPPKIYLANQGDYVDYNVPEAGLAGTRFWPGMGCDSSGDNCQIGQSGGPSPFTCPATIGCAPPVDSKFEATFGCMYSDTSQCQGNPSGGGAPLSPNDYWDTSMVDGYTLPYKVQVNGSCPAGPQNNLIDCSKLTLDLCPTNIDLSTNGEFSYLSDESLVLDYPYTSNQVGCYSPCSKLSIGQWQSIPDPPFNGTTYSPDSAQAEYYCCPTPPISVDQCRAGPGANNPYVSLIHGYCPQTYAYAYDDVTGNWNCPAGTQYTVTFYCP
jgi:hypothetical protein